MYEIIYLFAIIFLIYYIFYSWYNPKLVYVRSKVDNNIYIVRNLTNKEKAADMMAIIRKKLNTLVESLKQKYGNSDERINLLIKRFNSHEIRESLPKNNQTSYSINKGERIVLCLRSRDKNEKLTDINTITFVALHELAHIMTISIGHKPEFWENFRFLLAHAIKWNLYKPIDYKKYPKKYCGIKITESPLALKEQNKYL